MPVCKACRPRLRTCAPVAKTQTAPRGRSSASERKKSGFDVRLDVVDRLLHGGDLLGFLVRDFALEFLLERHHELDRVERVRAEIVHERGIWRDFIFLDAKLLDD